MPWLTFIAGLLAGGLIAGLWMRARLARLEAAKQFAESGAAKLTETFQALADAALRSNQSAFLDAARTTLETTRAEMSGDLAQKQTAIEGVVQPLADSIGRLEVHVRELERAREKAYGSLGEQVRTLARETATLSTALRSPQTRGRWGEVTLRRVAELAGMVHNCDFHEQETREGDGVRIRPDMIVRLPGDRTIVVDAKVPLTAYLDAVSAADEPTRKTALLRHAQQVSEHVRQLSSKQYWNQFQPAPELVVLFLPGDHFFSAALEIRPDLIEEALARKGRDRDAGDADLGAEGHRVRLEPGAAGRKRRGDPARGVGDVRSRATGPGALFAHRQSFGEDRGSVQPVRWIVGFPVGAGASQDAGAGRCERRRATGSRAD